MRKFPGRYADDQKELHKKVRAEAGNRCLRCKHPEGDKVLPPRFFGGKHGQFIVECDELCTHERVRKLRALTVHHLDGNKENNRWWNLLALCQVCHLQIQAQVIPERPFLFEHSEWFKPFVCGFYAHYYGGVEITRAEADETPLRFLAMGQPWLYKL